jgi:hypothetical protein
MAADDRTDRFRPVFEPEEIFDRFVKNANASTEVRAPRDDEPTGVVEGGEPRPVRGGPPTWDHQITVRAVPESEPPARDEEGTRPDLPLPSARDASPSDDEHDDDEEEDATAVRKPLAPLTDSGQRVVLLTKVKRAASEPARAKEPATWRSVVAPRGQHTQRIEASRVVPDVSAVAKKDPAPAVAEGVEDGQMPTRELDQILADMGVLLRYGHAGQVRDRLEQLRRTYPEDLLLLRRIAEFHIEHDQNEAALDTLFALAGGLFERRNVEGMRQALEQVLVIDPDNARAFRLLGLLQRRPRGAAGD